MKSSHQKDHSCQAQREMMSATGTGSAVICHLTPTARAILVFSPENIRSSTRSVFYNHPSDSITRALVLSHGELLQQTRYSRSELETCKPGDSSTGRDGDGDTRAADTCASDTCAPAARTTRTVISLTTPICHRVFN